MALLGSVPVSANIVVPYSNTEGAGLGTPNVKYSPKDLTGAVIDFSTGTWTAKLNVAAPISTSTERTTFTTVTVAAADASGITIGLTPAQSGSAATICQTASQRMTLEVNNGTDSYVVAQGTVNINLLP